MTATDDHGTLPVHAERMLRRLEAIENLAVPGDTAHMQHMDHAKRVRQLADHLRAVLLLSEANHYASALIVVRSALEHHLMDRLIFLANRYIVTYTKVKKKDVASWNVKLAAAQAGDQPDIATWFWDQSGMNVVHRGLTATSRRRDVVRPSPRTTSKSMTSTRSQAQRSTPGVSRHRSGRGSTHNNGQTSRPRRGATCFGTTRLMKALRVNRLLLGGTSKWTCTMGS